jgi:hypothetical protein
MSNLIEVIRDVVVIVTGIIASAFALYKYKKSREAEAVLQLELALKVHNFSAKNLVDVSIQIKNVGKAAAYVSPEGVKKALFMVRKVSCPENDEQLAWEQFENQKLINDVEYMGVYGFYYPEEDMIFEPSSIDTYSVFFSTDYYGPVWFRAELIDKEEYKWLVDRLFILPKP